MAADEHLAALADMLRRSRDAREKFAVGTAQHTLQLNRIHGLEVLSRLIEAELTGEALVPERQALERAKAPVASLLSKSRKAQEKLKPNSWQYAMLVRNIDALAAGEALLEKVLEE